MISKADYVSLHLLGSVGLYNYMETISTLVNGGGLMSIEQLVEYKNFGFNRATLFFFMVALMSMLEIYGLWLQNKKIRTEKSGKSLLAFWFIYFHFLFLSCFVYGIEIGSGVLMADLLVALFYLPIVHALLKTNGLKKVDAAVFFACLGALTAMIAYNIKEELFMVFHLAGVVVLVFGPLEIRKTRTRGVIEIKLILVYSFNSLVWACYGIVIRDFPLVFVSLSSFTAMMAMIFLWFRFSPAHLRKRGVVCANFVD
jgi:uncharacterized protein with PQ loop repeat